MAEGAGDTERLVVMLEARLRDFERNMAKASGTADTAYGRMRRGSRSATRQMEQDMLRSTGRINEALASTSTKIGSFAKTAASGFLRGGLAGVISAATVGTLQQVARGVAQVGDEARRAGLGIEAFQELKYVAEQNRIGVDGLVDGIKELNLRADEFIVTGGGAGAEAFARLGYSADELKAKLADPSALFTEIIGKLETLDRASAIRIADEIFGGTGGERFVQLIDQGADGIRATQREARQLGLIMSEELIAKADELDRKFNALSESVGIGLKSAIVSAAASLTDFIKSFEEFRSWADGPGASMQAGASMRELFPAAYGQAEGSLMRDLEHLANGGGGRSAGALYQGFGFTGGKMDIAAPQTTPQLASEVAGSIGKVGSALTSAGEAFDVFDTMVADLGPLLEGVRDPFAQMQMDLDQLGALLHAGTIDWDQYGDAVNRAKMSAVGDTLAMAGQITGIMAGMFEDNKAMQLANVGVNTAAGVAKTLADYGGTPWGWAAVAGVVASGAAQAAAIMSARPGSATTAGAGGTAGQSVAGAAPAAATPQTVVNVSMPGGRRSYTREELRQMFEDIQSASKYGLKVDFS